VNVVTGEDPFNTAFLGGAFSIPRPNVVPGVPFYLHESNAPGGKVINAAAFRIPAAAQQGDLGRNALRGFGATQWDLTLCAQPAGQHTHEPRKRLPVPRVRAASASTNIGDVGFANTESR
jgi:hypothetical protein